MWPRYSSNTTEIACLLGLFTFIKIVPDSRDYFQPGTIFSFIYMGQINPATQFCFGFFSHVQYEKFSPALPGQFTDCVFMGKNSLGYRDPAYKTGIPAAENCLG